MDWSVRSSVSHKISASQTRQVCLLAVLCAACALCLMFWDLGRIQGHRVLDKEAVHRKIEALRRPLHPVILLG
jgi:hypothetical protein